MYQKVKVQQEINVQKRDAFWSKSEVSMKITTSDVHNSSAISFLEE